MSIILSGTTGIDAGSLPVNNTGKLSAGTGLPIVLNTAGVDRVTVDTSGNVGVGTGSPVDKLTIYSANGNTFSRTQSGSSTLLTGVYSDGSACVNSLGSYPLLLLTNNTERMRIDAAGNVLVTGTGLLGYGTGAGGQVAQLTSKSTAVTLNKPCGVIIMNNAALAAGASVQFIVHNSIVTNTDNVVLTNNWGAIYSIRVVDVNDGFFYVVVKNESAGSLSEAVAFNFTIIKGAVA